jgi:hypothetical protein
MMRKLIVVIYHMLKKKIKYYYVKKELHRKKLYEWLSFMKKIKAMSDDDWRNWEKRVRMKYELIDRKKKIQELKNIA